MYLVKCPLTDREVRAEWVHYGNDGFVWYKELVGGCTIKLHIAPIIRYVHEDNPMTDEMKQIEFMNSIHNNLK